ncbi:hypothetical protein CEXT_257991 [Caerostris extrusa]|uniref:Uncharacterized protein n=1 Tax=Caerostris extrusa TaxID=172846 RepID=A0AAV4NKY7_CAEEX|nr:hypothetical protein CEXT_257991 [Caerostris extrusa]
MILALAHPSTVLPNPNVDSVLGATVPFPVLSSQTHQSTPAQPPSIIAPELCLLSHYSLRHLAEREWQRIVMRLR